MKKGKRIIGVNQSYDVRRKERETRIRYAELLEAARPARVYIHGIGHREI